ncbi:hypothetical protein AMTRI_Chr03g45590 [Amborella trichopoda]
MNDLMTKSFTSYVDLKKEALKDLEAGPDLEMEAQFSSTDQNLIPFFKEVGAIKDEMEAIELLLEKLKESNEETKRIHKPEALKSLRNRINSDVVNILKKAKTIKIMLEELDRQNLANRRLSGFKEGTPLDRTRSSVTNGLRKKLKELMMDFQALRTKIMVEYKETVERRYFTVTGDYASEEMIENIISSGQSESFLQKAIAEQGRGKILETVNEIQDRHDAAKEIERSLLELHQVFLDMAVMVEAQGEKMDDIEHHVMNAATYVKDGTKNLKAAKEYQRSSRRWMCFGLTLLLALIFFVIVPIITSLSNS